MADYPLRVQWCLAIGAPAIAARGGDIRELGGWDREGIARSRGLEDIECHTGSWEAAGRTVVAGFAELFAAMLAFEERTDELSSPGAYAMHPEGASRELQRRIGFSMFAQGWLPFLDDREADTLLDKTGLAREYDAVGTIATSSWPCASCGGAIALVAGAKRVVCDHCGRLVTVTGS